MTATLRWLVAASILTAAAATAPTIAAPVPPGTSPLAIVPAQAPIVIQIRGVDRTKERLTALLKNAVPDFGPIAAMQVDKMIQDGVEGRKLQGLEKEGPIFVVFLTMPNPESDEPDLAVIARVSKYAEFRDGLLADDERKALKSAGDGVERTEIKGKEVFFIDRAGWAIITPSKDSLALFGKENAGLNSKLAADLARRFTESDVAAYVNLAAINKQFGDQIKEAKDTLFGLMDQFGGQDKATMDMAKAIYGGVFQVLEDGKAIVVALDFRPQGLSFQVASQIGADTPTNKFLKDQKPSKLTGLGTMPAGQVIYSGTEFAPSLFKIMAPMMFASAGEGEARAALEKAMNDMIAAGTATAFSAGRFPAQSFQVQTFSDPVKAVAAQLAMFRAMGEGAAFQTGTIKGKPEIRDNDQSYRGFKFNYVKLVWDLDKLAEQVPGGGEDVKAAMQKLMGDGLQMWFGTDGNQVLTVTAKDWADAKAQIDGFLDGKTPVSGVAAFDATRKELPAESTMLTLADGGKFAMAMGDYMLSLFKAIPGIPFNLPASMKPVETEPSFIGISVVMKPEHGSFEMFLPAKAVQEIRKVLQPLFLGGE